MRPYIALLLLAITGLVQAQPTRSIEQIGDESFEVWQKAGDDFAMYCKEPCAGADEDIQTFYQTVAARLPDLIDWHGVDVIEELKPVEIHLNASDICPAYGNAAGYARISYHRGPDDKRGLNCLFEIERGVDDLAERGPILALHEYAHLILFERHRYSYEYFTYWSSWDVTDPTNDFADPCSAFYENFADTRAVHDLCENFGLTQSDVRSALVELDRRFRSDEGFLYSWSAHGHTTSVAELRGLFDALLADDTSSAWTAGGWPANQIGMDFSVGPEAAAFEAVGGRIRIDAPAGSASNDLALRLDKPNSATGGVPFTHFPRNFAIVTEGTSSNPFEPTVTFDPPLTISFEPEPFFLNTQRLDTYDLMEMRFDASGRPFWRPVPGSHYDPASGRVVGEIRGTGHYAYGPAFQAPAGMFYDPDLSGHGFDIQMSGDQVFVIFFTYDLGGDPFWLIGNAPLGNVAGRSQGTVEMTLSRVERNPDNGDLAVSPSGRLQLNFYGSQTSRGWRIQASAEVEVDGITDGQPVDMTLEQLAFGDSRATDVQVTGHWYDPSDSGWGLTIDRKGSTELAVAYFYDEQGQPRWAIGTREIDSAQTELETVAGYCIACEVAPRTVTQAGSLTPAFDDSGRTGVASLDVAWPPAGSPGWTRPNAAIVPLSNPPVYRVDPRRLARASTTLHATAPSKAAGPSTTPRFGIDCAMPHGPASNRVATADQASGASP